MKECYKIQTMSKQKPGGNPGHKRKPPPRKFGLSGWPVVDDSDDLDIGPWMIRRVDGETRKDPRTAPAHNRFLWSSNYICKAIDNTALFLQDSLHRSLSGQIQVVLTKCNDEPSTEPKVTPSPTGSKDGENKDMLTVDKPSGDNHNIEKESTNTDVSTQTAISERNDSEVLRFKKLLSIARKNRHRRSVTVLNGDHVDYGEDFNRWDSDLNGDFHSISTDDEIPHCNKQDNSKDRQIKFSYTQGINCMGPVPRINDEQFDGEEESTERPVGSTPFITTLNNYKNNIENDKGLHSRVKIVSSNKISSNDKLKSLSPDSEEDEERAPQSPATVRLHQSSSIYPFHSQSSKNKNDISRLFVKPTLTNQYSMLSSNDVLRNRSLEGIFSDSPNTISINGNVFPIGELLPVVGSQMDRKAELVTAIGDNPPDSTTITGKDLLMHRERGERIYIIQKPQKMLGPPPFRPVTNRTPLQRARENSRKRIFGNTFAQETQDLYEKLLSCKNGVTEHNSGQASQRRSGHKSLFLSRSAGSNCSRSRRPLGHTVSDTEFHEARARLSTKHYNIILRRSKTEL